MAIRIYPEYQDWNLLDTRAFELYESSREDQLHFILTEEIEDIPQHHPLDTCEKKFLLFTHLLRSGSGHRKSVATTPVISTYQQQGKEARQMADVPPQMIRLCVGGEDPDDIIQDLDQALGSL